MKTLILSIVILLCLPGVLFGQSFKAQLVNVHGEPIIWANIQWGDYQHTHSDELGQFTIRDIQSGDTLTISHLGYGPHFHIVQDFDGIHTIVLEERAISLDQVTVKPDTRSLSVLSELDLRTNPVQSTQELLYTIPGLFIAQHAGGGKAEQMFLRGFDTDHGTDIRIEVDNMPVNMVSHAHGQGYADLHFLIPETVESVDYGKGPYYTDQGNFSTAGHVQFKTIDQLEKSLVKVEAGNFNTQRGVGLVNILNQKGHSAYVATELITTDGPFESPQQFGRLNIMGKYTMRTERSDQLEIVISHFTSRWDASGQIPQRAVDEGLISRFGAIDDTEGGETSRTNFTINHIRPITDNSYIKTSLFASRYRFELFSNFTFFLNDPINGDQIKQQENRDLYGWKSSYHRDINIAGFKGALQASVGFRQDISKNNELSNTLNRRTTLDIRQLGTIRELNTFALVDVKMEFGRILLQGGIRLDNFSFSYLDKLDSLYQPGEFSDIAISPNLNLSWDVSEGVQVYLKNGFGFHSNDTRVVVNRAARTTLPIAIGNDIGTLIKAGDRILINLAFWHLYLEQEFVWVGDEGIVEPSPETRRFGLDLSVRYQLTNRLFLEADLNYARARFINGEEGSNYIPLAPEWVGTGRLSYINPNGFFGSLNVRMIADRPANENNTIIAQGYELADLNIGYQWDQVQLSLAVQNLFDTEWNESQFATESRLANETRSVEELHFTPGVPFNARLILQYAF